MYSSHHSPDDKYRKRRSSFLRWFAAVLVLLGIASFTSLYAFIPLMAIVLGMTGFLFIDSLRRNTYFHKLRDEGAVRHLAWWSLGVYSLSLFCVLAALALMAIDYQYLGGNFHQSRSSLYFAAGPLQWALDATALLWSLASFTPTVLFWMLVWTWWKNAAEKRILSKLAFAAHLQWLIAWLLMIVAPPTPLHLQAACDWRINHTFHGSDGHTYYLLQTPLISYHGTHSAIARRTGGNAFYNSLKIVTPDYGEGDAKKILQQGTKDPMPEVRQLCLMLLQSETGGN